MNETNLKLKPDNFPEEELKALVSECMALQITLQLNIQSLLKSFNEVANDNYSSESNKLLEEQNEGAIAS